MAERHTMFDRWLRESRDSHREGGHRGEPPCLRKAASSLWNFEAPLSSKSKSTGYSLNQTAAGLD